MRILFGLLLLFQPMVSGTWIRLNLAGYLPDSRKAAVMVTDRVLPTVRSFRIVDAYTGTTVWTSDKVKRYGMSGPFSAALRLDFSKFTITGRFQIVAGGVTSPAFTVSSTVYSGAADLLLTYMRQQRSGFNPFLRDSCHTADGFIIGHPTLDSTHIDVSGGWHDAADYLQYVTTTATATYQLMFAYQQNPTAFADHVLANGLPGANGIPDVLDEARWGLQWLLKMNPGPGLYFNQLADDRDHRGFRLPTEDTVDYGRGKERPVYFVSGQPQGIYQYKNRTTGAASTVAKFSSAFALGAELFRTLDPSFAAVLKEKSTDALHYALDHPGVCQTAPCRAPYFYEEDNWTDDVELAAAQQSVLTGERRFIDTAAAYGRMERVTPWIGADTARHYQWYPFIALGHAMIARTAGEHRKEFLAMYREGIERLWKRSKDDPFLFGIPFIWCSNNLVSSMLEQLSLYRTMAHDDRYEEMEASLRDWLFGCNPWGTSMVSGFPAMADSPIDPHSAFSHVYGYPVTGGLVDGPVRASIFEQHRRYISLTRPDPYAAFQSDRAVYHDDWGDYTNNEPTMDGTASLTMYLSTLHRESLVKKEHSVNDHGAVIRMDTTTKVIRLVFTGHEFADGASVIRKVLHDEKIHASFFFTGTFYRDPRFRDVIRSLKKDGHYLGPHSGAHLLYAPWENRDSLLITRQQFIDDLADNYRAMAPFGISTGTARVFLPPFEWFNDSIRVWTSAEGLSLINFTPGTSSNADYTTPEMSNYLPSDSITTRILRKERNDPNGLNGFILLSHIGTDPKRTDKFYRKLREVIVALKRRGYSFTRF